MLSNNDFFKTLNVLYVESDNTQDKKLLFDLKRLFNEIYLFNNGTEALNCFFDDEHKIDIIISDIYLDDILGVDILEKIREKDEDIPFIISTEKIETETLLKAVKLNATDFLMKPIENFDFVACIEKVCQNRFFNKFKKNVQKDLEDIIDIVNEVALVSKTDLDENITFANKSFCEVSGYSEEELIGNNHSLIRDPNRVLDEEISTTIKSGNVWEGKIKNSSKNGEEFYVYITVIPLFNEHKQIKEFIWIRFLATEYELEQKNFKKKVAKNINENRRINTRDREKIDELMNKLSHYQSLDFLIKQEKERKDRFESQLLYSNKQSTEGEIKLKDISSRAKEKINTVVKAQQDTKKITDETSTNLNKYIDEYQLKNKTVKELLAELELQKKTIDKLRLKIENRENKLGLND